MFVMWSQTRQERDKNLKKRGKNADNNAATVTEKMLLKMSILDQIVVLAGER